MPAVDPVPWSPPAAPQTVERRRWAALWLLCASQFLIILDGSIVAVALPVIGADLATSGPALTWVVNGYLVALGGSLLLAGRLGDLLGPRRVLLGGLATFTAASLACGLASRIEVLVAARFVQGVGGALASAVVLGMIVTLYPEAGERGKALAAFGFVGAAGSSVGLLAGGLLTTGLSWPWIFLVNVPLGLAALRGVHRLVPDPPGSGGRADLLGALLVTGGLMLAVLVVLSTDTSAMTAGLLTLAAVGLLAGFLARQARFAAPLLPLRLLTSRSVGLGNLVQVLVVAGLFGYQFLGVLYLQHLLGYDPLQAGLAYLPVPMVIAIVSLVLTARLTSRLGLRPVLVVGLVLIVAGLALLARIPASGSYLPDVLPAGLLIAAGFGLAFPSLAAVAVGSAPAGDAGVASGLFATTQQVGGALGLALLTRLATTNNDGHTAVSVDGYHAAFGAAAGLAATALLLALPATAARQASDASSGDDAPQQ
ncbi:MFS transporter [Geodermatophilus sp. SYSU D00700]